MFAELSFDMKINARIPKKGLSLVSSKWKPGQPFGKHGHSFRKLAHPFGKQAHPFGNPDPHSGDGEVFRISDGLGYKK